MHEPGLGEALQRARDAYTGRAWRAAREDFAAAAAHSRLPPADMESYARTALLTGDDDEYVKLLARASQGWASESNPARAAECTCYIAMNLSFRGQWGPASGWLNRAQQHVDAVDGDCPAEAWLIAITAIQRLFSGDPEGARQSLDRAVEIGQRCSNADVSAMARMAVAQCLLTMGRVAEAMSRLDEIMVSVVADELNPVVTGIVYCALVSACQEGYDARRAAEWTRALAEWCDAQPDLMPFRGQCLVHRAQIMQLQGHWADAMEQAGRALEQLSRPPGHPAIGAAHFEAAELHRLLGEFAEAEQAYELAGRFGHETQPGRALLRLGQGKPDQARNGITRALSETPGALRPKLLAAAVDVALASDDMNAAQAYADELADIAGRYDSLLLTAMSKQASGVVLMAKDEPAEALPLLRRSWQAWQEVDAPYFAARVRVSVGRACWELGDADAAATEFEAAWSIFERLGARSDLDALRKLRASATAAGTYPAGLTSREVEVLRLVASGKTNRAIATQLVLSDKTIARHVSNVFAKLGVSSRSAATAYAYEHGLV